MKAAHHRGTYHVRSRQLVALANANPDTRCWRCGMTLAEYTERHGARRARWTAGHINDGEVDGELAPEHHHCNTSAGARQSSRNKTSRAW